MLSACRARSNTRDALRIKKLERRERVRTFLSFRPNAPLWQTAAFATLTHSHRQDCRLSLLSLSPCCSLSLSISPLLLSLLPSTFHHYRTCRSRFPSIGSSPTTLFLTSITSVSESFRQPQSASLSQHKLRLSHHASRRVIHLQLVFASLLACIRTVVQSLHPASASGGHKSQGHLLAQTYRRGTSAHWRPRLVLLRCRLLLAACFSLRATFRLANAFLRSKRCFAHVSRHRSP